MRIPTPLSSKGLSLLVMIVIALLTVACSSTVFVYNHLPHFIPWYIDDYVELDAGQQRKLDDLLASYLQQHRQDVLPRYRDILDQVLLGLDGTLTVEDAERIYAQVEVEFNHIQAETLDWMLVVGESLTDRQMEQFLLKLKAQQDEYEDEYLQRDDDRFRRDVYSDLKRNFKEYLGRLQPQQSEQLRGAANRLHRLDQYWLARRQYRVERLAVILERKPEWQQRVVSLMQETDLPGAAEYELRYQHNLQQLLEITVSLVNGRSDRQDRHLRSKLRGLREDIDQLNRQRQGGDQALNGRT